MFIVGDPFSSYRLGPVTVRNRFVKAATFEGMADGGRVTDRLIDYVTAPARGGVGTTTVAYCSVAPGGRTFRDQIVVDRDAVAGLRRLTDAVHAEGAAACIQLGHAGYFANRSAIGGRTPVGPNRVFNPAGLAFSREATPDDLERLAVDFATAAERSVQAGFDVVEVHVGHGYLLSQFLSPFTNRRRDAYGGDIEGRARFPREVLRRVRDRVGDRAAVTAKLNVLDGFRRGLQEADGVEVARMLEADGTVDALQLTAGFTAKTPMFLLRGDVPIGELADNERDRLRRLGLKVAGRLILKRHPFTEAFLLDHQRAVRAATTLPLAALGGITRLDTARQLLDEGFELIAMARALLREPDLIERWATGDEQPSRCVPCNRCIVEMEIDGTRCVRLPPGTEAPGHREPVLP